MIVTRVNRTPEEIEVHLGRQVRRARLAQDLSQQALADRANVSLGAIRHIEEGSGATLRSLASAVRALGYDEWFDMLFDAPEVTPRELAKARERSVGRLRASRRRSVGR
jgi:transcriptional regulator with XRE-family HTH domain